MVEIVRLRLVTYHPVIEPVSDPAPGKEISSAETDRQKPAHRPVKTAFAGQVVIYRRLKPRHVLAFFQKLPPCLVGIRGSTIKNPGIRVWLGRGARRAIMRTETNRTVGQDRAVAFSRIDRKAA